MRKVIVFGGSGFLGSYVADELSNRGYDVTIADVRKSIYLKDSQKFVKCDILNLERVKKIVHGSDIVYNFAGLADLNVAINVPLQAIKLNVTGNLNILEACKEANIKRFVYASSAYAFNTKGSFYGISKHASEKLVEEFYNRYRLEYTIIRYGSLYGDRADSSNYIFKLLSSAIENKEIVLKGDENEAREYIHAADAARLSVNIVEDEQFINGHLILTGIEKLRRKDLFTMIQEILREPIKIKRVDPNYLGHYKVTPYEYLPNSSKKLVANPFIDMGQGLVDCIKAIYAAKETFEYNDD